MLLVTCLAGPDSFHSSVQCHHSLDLVGDLLTLQQPVHSVTTSNLSGHTLRLRLHKQQLIAVYLQILWDIAQPHRRAEQRPKRRPSVAVLAPSVNVREQCVPKAAALPVRRGTGRHQPFNERVLRALGIEAVLLQQRLELLGGLRAQIILGVNLRSSSASIHTILGAEVEHHWQRVANVARPTELAICDVSVIQTRFDNRGQVQPQIRPTRPRCSIVNLSPLNHNNCCVPTRTNPSPVCDRSLTQRRQSACVYSPADAKPSPAKTRIIVRAYSRAAALSRFDVCVY